MQKFEEVISSNRKKFDSILEDIDKSSNRRKKIALCGQAAILAFNNPCGALNAFALEDILIKISQDSFFASTEKVKKNSFLHVMTRCYSSGGHTRVVERWIASADKDSTHSVVLTGQGSRSIPDLLSQRVKEKSGHMLNIIGKDHLDVALQLRKIACEYEYIILHAHSYDIIPMLAFGTEKFTRPVILYNHSDAWFWVGVSIADFVVEFTDFGMRISKKLRGTQKSCILPLPVDEILTPPVSVKEKYSLKESLGFEKNTKIILTISSAYKFLPIKGIDYMDFMTKFLNKHEDIRLLLIGPHDTQKMIVEANKSTGGKIKAIGVIPNDEIYKYISIADVALDSFPLSSPTSLFDIAKYHVPCLVFNVPHFEFKIFDTEEAICKDLQELELKICNILFKNKKQKMLLKLLEERHLPKGFKKELKECVSKFPQSHKLHKFKQGKADHFIGFQSIIAKNTIAKNSGTKGKVKSFIRKILYFYIKHIYPIGMTSRLYRYLNSFGLV